MGGSRQDRHVRMGVLLVCHALLLALARRHDQAERPLSPEPPLPIKRFLSRRVTTKAHQLPPKPCTSSTGGPESPLLWYLILCPFHCQYLARNTHVRSTWQG